LQQLSAHCAATAVEAADGVMPRFSCSRATVDEEKSPTWCTRTASFPGKQDTTPARARGTVEEACGRESPCARNLEGSLRAARLQPTRNSTTASKALVSGDRSPTLSTRGTMLFGSGRLASSTPERRRRASSSVTVSPGRSRRESSALDEAVTQLMTQNCAESLEGLFNVAKQTLGQTPASDASQEFGVQDLQTPERTPRSEKLVPRPHSRRGCRGLAPIVSSLPSRLGSSKLGHRAESPSNLCLARSRAFKTQSHMYAGDRSRSSSMKASAVSNSLVKAVARAQAVPVQMRRPSNTSQDEDRCSGH